MNDRHSCCGPDETADVSREDVRSFYSKAAVTAQDSLCCPTKYNGQDLSHIPQEVLEISYGCGSPVGRANIMPGEVMVDLGSGGGIDCFIAAKYVGESGRVIGIDMTEDMLAVAKKNAGEVSKNLGYNNLDFKQGFLESIPLADGEVDLVTSNCVINLSTQKQEVFKEIYRILKPGGRFVIADIISDREAPEEMANNKELWGECVSGAVTLGEFIKLAKDCDFSGFTIKKDYLWKEVEGIKFFSYILEGHKHVPSGEASCCKTVLATYVGPFNSITCGDTVFTLGVPVEVDEEDSELLTSKPYREFFNISDPENEKPEDPESSCC